MSKLIDITNLVDAQEVSHLLGLAHRNTVSSYQKRYPEMPRPIIDLGQGRPRLWLRAEIEEWQSGTTAKHLVVTHNRDARK